MCDTVPGSLLLVHHHKDPAAQQVLSDIYEERIEGVSGDGDLESMLASRHAHSDDNLPFRVHRLRVPEGQELWKLNAVLHDYVRVQVDLANGEADMTPS